MTNLGFPAYHGSPHDFEKFSLHKIGTGEGAQVFGWGAYFAGDKAVADYYRKQLTQAQENVSLSPGLTAAGAKAAVIARLRAGVLQEGICTTGDCLDAKKTERARAQADFMSSPEWAPYHAELLDYDKKLSEQPTGLIGKLVAARLIDVTPLHQYVVVLRPDGEGLIDVGHIDRVTGRSLYQALVMGHSEVVETDLDVQSSAEWASKKLLQAGIPGLKYLDHDSRSGKKGTHNYVIWDDRRIEVKEKFHGLGGAARWMRTPGGWR